MCILYCFVSLNSILFYPCLFSLIKSWFKHFKPMVWCLIFQFTYHEHYFLMFHTSEHPFMVYCLAWWVGMLQAAFISIRLDGKKEGRNVLFNNTLNTFNTYGIRHMVKDHSDSERGNFLLPLCELFFLISIQLFYIHRLTDRIVHVTAFVEHWLEHDGFTMKDHYTMSRHSTTELHLAPRLVGG